MDYTIPTSSKEPWFDAELIELIALFAPPPPPPLLLVLFSILLLAALLLSFNANALLTLHQIHAN